MTGELPAFTILLPPGAWHHPRLAWWAVQMRCWGYRGPLPRWAVVTCQAVYPDAVCGCGAYALDWRDAGA